MSCFGAGFVVVIVVYYSVVVVVVAEELVVVVVVVIAVVIVMDDTHAPHISPPGKPDMYTAHQACEMHSRPPAIYIAVRPQNLAGFGILRTHRGPGFQMGSRHFWKVESRSRCALYSLQVVSPRLRRLASLGHIFSPECPQ